MLKVDWVGLISFCKSFKMDNLHSNLRELNTHFYFKIEDLNTHFFFKIEKVFE